MARGITRAATLAAIIAAASGCGGRGATLAVTAQPASATADVPVTIYVRGLKPDTHTTVRLSGTSVDGGRWAGTVPATSTDAGEVVLRDAYLYPHMRAARGALGPWPQTVTITVRGPGSEATTKIRRSPTNEIAVTTHDLRPGQVGFYGEWLVPRHARKHTAILMFGGSEGGLFNGELATALAAHGYPVLHLAYFGLPGLPPSLRDVPLEYFERAARWVAAQPEVDPHRIVTWGWSRGGEASLLVASTFPSLVHAAVAYVPSGYIWGAVGDPLKYAAWTYRGKPLHMRATSQKLLASDEIPIWNISGPVFAVGGYDDQVWPSGFFVHQIAVELRAHHRKGFEALAYAKAGHGLFHGTPAQILASPIGYGQVGLMNFGGSPEADEAGLEDSWPKLLRFLSAL